MALLTEDVEQELSATAQQVLGKLWSHQLFQSKWDTGAFIIFLVFLGEYGLASGPRQASQAEGHIWIPILPTGVVALLLLVVCIHCCCCGCCQSHSSRSRKVSPEHQGQAEKVAVGWGGAGRGPRIEATSPCASLAETRRGI